MRRDRVFLTVATLAAAPVIACAFTLGSGGCKPPNRGSTATSFGPCDPLAPPASALGTIIGVGENAQGTFYVADQAPDGSGQDRVFVSSGNTLYRQHVAGSGQRGGPPDTDYTFSFAQPFAEAGDTQALLVQVRGGAVTAMALGPGNSRNFIGAPDAGDVPLTVVDAGAVAGFKLQNLPNVVEYVADVNGGDSIVITAPMDAWGYSGFRLFYGTPSQMVERPIAAYNQSGSGPADISFSVGEATYTLQIGLVFDPDAGPFGRVGPSGLDVGDGGMVPVTLRLPPPPFLSGFSFMCSSAEPHDAGAVQAPTRGVGAQTGATDAGPPVEAPPSMNQGSAGIVSGPPTQPAQQVSAGGQFACALLTDGGVRCWGMNLYQQLGDGQGEQQSALPVQVVNSQRVIAISAGGYHTCAILADHTVECWGWNKYGQIGDGTTVDRPTPVPIPGLGGVVEISCGSLHTCARLTDNTLRCWGNGGDGQIGDGYGQTRFAPTAVLGLTGVAGVSAGDLTTCAYLSDGTARCWGDNANGELGDGTTQFRLLPSPVVGLTSVTGIAAGSGDACAVLSDGTVQCWGINTYGEVGDGTMIQRVSPSAVPGIASGVRVFAGAPFACALLSGQTVECWGDNSSGTLGDGTTVSRPTPAPVLGLSRATQLSGSLLHACALKTDGSIVCWGNNQWGQIGDGTTVQRTTPSQVAL